MLDLPSISAPWAVQALPLPTTDGSLDDLRDLVNATDESWVLLKSWLVASVRLVGSYAILVLTSEHGSGKSSLSKMLRRLIDPNQADLRSLPRSEDDLIIAARNGWVLGFDNLSCLSTERSDALCRLATGGGLSKRKLYTDSGEILFEGKRPMLLNGIEDVATREDLLSRSIVISLPQIQPGKRMTERKLWARYEELRPRVLGGLLDAVSCAMRRGEDVDVQLTDLPRLSDFAHWATAAEPAMGLNDGDFMTAYNGNRENANELALEGSIISIPVRHLVDDNNGAWEGKASELLDALRELVSEDTRKRKGWPNAANVLGGMLRRIAPNLREAGIDITFGKEKGARHIRLQSK